MKNRTDRLIILAAAALALSLAWAPGAGAQAQTQDSAQVSATSQPTRAQMQAQAQTEVEKQRKEAEQQVEKSIDRDAIAVVLETQRALQAISAQKTDEALAAIERATGKVNVLLARNPSAALIPVDATVQVIDLAPVDASAIKEIARSADRAVDERDYPAARVLLDGLISEIRVRTYNLPLASYPAALREAARLLNQKNTAEARAVLLLALNSMVLMDRITPLPYVLAQAAIDQAQAERDKDKEAAQKYLTTARQELERARLLGYADKDPEYDALRNSISDLEKQLRGKENTTSAFSALKEKLAAFFKRHSGGEKRSNGAK